MPPRPDPLRTFLSALLFLIIGREPVWAGLQIPAEDVYPIVEEVIAKHGRLPELQRLGALSTVPRENYSWLIGQIAVGYYTDWSNMFDPDIPINESKAPLIRTCKGPHAISERRHARPAGQLIIVTVDCDESLLPPDRLVTRAGLYYLHWTKFHILQLFHSVGRRNDDS